MKDGLPEPLGRRLIARSDIRVERDKLSEAHDWYCRWFAVQALLPTPTYFVGDVTFHLLPRDGPHDPGHSVLALETSDAVRSAAELLAAGAKLSFSIVEWESRVQVECVDAFGTCWRLVQNVDREIDAIRSEVRQFAARHGSAIQRLGGLTRVGRGVPYVGPAPFDAARPTLYCLARPPSALGLPHYEEYDGYRTTGEPWFYWGFDCDGVRVLFQYSATVESGQLYTEFAAPDLALTALGLSAEGWMDARPPGTKFRVMRQDDNGNVFEVAVVDSEWTARRRVAELEAVVHKQHYWLEPIGPPAAK